MIMSDGNVIEHIKTSSKVQNMLLKSPLTKFDILKAEIIYFKNREMLINNFQIVYSKVEEQIGSPVSYQQFSNNNFLNKRGKTSIPRDFCVKKEEELEGGQANGDQGLRDGGNFLSKSRFQGVDIYTDINSLSFRSKSWILKMRCVEKSPIRSFKRGFNDHKLEDGQVQNVIFEDNFSKIQAVLFNEQVSKFATTLVEGQLYSVMGAEIKTSSRFNKTENSLELHFNKHTQVDSLVEDYSVPFTMFNQKKVGDLKGVGLGQDLDILGVVASTQNPRILGTRDGRKIFKTELQIYDESETLVEVAIWGSLANLGAVVQGDIVFLRHLKLKEFRGYFYLSSCSATKIELFPSHVLGYNELKLWKENRDSKNGEEKNKLTFFSKKWEKSPKNLIRIADLDKLSSSILTQKSQKMYFDIDGVALSFGKSMYYNACPNEKCLKKVIQSEDTKENWYCPKCDIIYTTCNPRYIGSVKIADDSSSMYATVNREEIGQLLFGGMTCLEFKERTEGMDRLDLDNFMSTFKFKYLQVRVMAKYHEYEGKESVRYTIISSGGDSRENCDALKERQRMLMDTLAKIVDEGVQQEDKMEVEVPVKGEKLHGEVKENKKTDSN